MKQLLYPAKAQKIELDALKLALAGRQGTDLPFEVALDWPQLAVDAQSLKGSALSGQLKLSGATQLSGKFSSGAPSGNFDALKLPAVTLAMQGQMQQRKVDAHLKADMRLNAGKGAVAVETLDLRATLAAPGLLAAPSPIGGKQIAIIPNAKDSLLAQDGDYLISSAKLGLTDALALQVEPLKVKIEKLLDNANTMVLGINDVLNAKNKQNLQASLQNLNETLAQFKLVSAQANDLLAENKSKINSALSNVDKVSANFVKVSDSISKIQLGETVKKLENTLANVNHIMTDIDAGKGSMGKLIGKMKRFTTILQILQKN